MTTALGILILTAMASPLGVDLIDRLLDRAADVVIRSAR